MSQQNIDSLYNDHHRWLFQWLNQRLRCTHQAEDLAQDTFIRILAGQKVAIKEPRAYLMTIAKGILANWYKRQSIERAYLDALSLLPENEMPSEEQRYLILETLQKIDTMLDSLPSAVKNVFLLSQIEGLKYAAIAKQLDVSLITVKRHMKRAFTHCLLVM